MWLLYPLFSTANHHGGPCTARHQRPSFGLNNIRFLEKDKCGDINLEERTVTDIFSVIGDYGDGKEGEKDVARLMDLVAEYHNQEYRDRAEDSDVDYVITVGDDAYPMGLPEDLDASISDVYGKYLYHGHNATIQPDHPSKSEGEDYIFRPNTNTTPTQRFFPCGGNHDFSSKQHSTFYHKAYFNYLENYPPYNGFAYTVRLSKHIQLFVIKDLDWLYSQAAKSDATFKFAVTHHGPFGTSKHHPNNEKMDGDYSRNGISMFLSGHVHCYERLELCDKSAGLPRTPPCQDGSTPIPYLINGIGGFGTENINAPDCIPAEGSIFRYGLNYGFVLGIVSERKDESDPKIDFCLYSLDNLGSKLDSWTLNSKSNAPTSLLAKPTVPTSLLAKDVNDLHHVPHVSKKKVTKKREQSLTPHSKPMVV